MNVRMPSIFVFVVLAVIALQGCGEGNSAAPAAAPPPPVSVAAVIEKRVNDWDEFTGRLEAVDTVDVRPRVSGYIERVAFHEGSEVERGDLLFEIDPRPFQTELNRVEAELARARSQFELAQSQLRRSEQLLQQNFISQQAYDDRASASREAAANVKAAEAAVANARLNLDYTKVRSPVAGRVGRAEVTVGNLVNRPWRTQCVAADHSRLPRPDLRVLRRRRAGISEVRRAGAEPANVRARARTEPDLPRARPRAGVSASRLCRFLRQPAQPADRHDPGASGVRRTRSARSRPACSRA